MDKITIVAFHDNDARHVASKIGDVFKYVALSNDLPSTTLVAINSISIADIESTCERIGIPYTVGAANIWRQFPFLRAAFIGNFQIQNINGEGNQTLRLYETVAGDERLESGICLSVLNRFDDIFEVSEAELALYIPQLRIARRDFYVDIEDKLLIFVENFCLDNQHSAKIAEEISYLSYREFYKCTNFRDIFNVRKTLFGEQFDPLRALIPDRFSGVFIVEKTVDGDFALTTVLRILSAASIFAGAWAQALSHVKFNSTQHVGTRLPTLQFRMPFARRTFLPKKYVSATDENFAKALTIIRSSNVSKFRKSKDDFRLLSLDTAADSIKTTSLVIQYAEIWMALEKLLSFKTENTTQLALCLSALVEPKLRINEFAAAKKAYNLRSKIVHGYSFDQEEDLVTRIDWISERYRRTFEVSMSKSNADELQSFLTSTVVGGTPAPITDEYR